MEEKDENLCCGPRVRDTILGILDTEINTRKGKAEPFGELLESRSFVETLKACDIEKTIRESASAPVPLDEKIDVIVKETTPVVNIDEELKDAMAPREPVRPARPDEKIIPKEGLAKDAGSPTFWPRVDLPEVKEDGA